ncbi:DUF4129 domain-containing protein [Dactylosporangium sucinum]|uniref:Protein-glutamine gamma-glutamyltransferase-like C-terminal domain-containing protein n=1 Tax=Dactylosporangium sucinum TaxID=1424081 RepID=A0A917WMR4_9ACTN|nr:DUF4129 domain-containing protein [Dactylosporangium sucinum]GGM16993.1 hypothetical protein GCM10007977_017780 [Dactylosporangium sucinum]
MDRTISRWLPVLAVVAVLGIAIVAAALSSPEVTSLPVPELDPTAAPTGLPTAEPSLRPTMPPGDGDPGFALPDWILYGVTGLCAVVVIALVAGLVYMFLRNAGPKAKPRLFVEPEAPAPMQVDTGEEVVAAVDAGLAELADTDGDPRRAVIACWVRLERAAAAAGTPRLVGDSPTELVTRLLAGHRVTRPTLEGLAEVYREARYATHPVDERSRQAAVGALSQLRAELSGVAHGT